MFDKKPYLVAEVGSNWRTLDDCLESIRVAKECGADAVKFQAFHYEALYGLAPDYGVAGSGVPFPATIEPYELELEWLPALKAKAVEVGIDFACTAFSPDLVRVVDPYVKWHKVASSDAAWPQLLEAVRRTGKPVVISYNEANSDPCVIRSIADVMNIHVAIDYVRLKCVASYPADYCDLSEIGQGFYDGLSDHTLGYTAAVEAARLDAVVIEKHFTAFPDLDTPDRPHSLTPAQFKRMVKLIRGEPVESEETVMFLRANRRLIATRDVEPGTAMHYGENFGAYRSLVDDTRGASPFDWEKVEGKAAKGEIKRGTAIAVEDVE